MGPRLRQMPVLAAGGLLVLHAVAVLVEADNAVLRLANEILPVLIPLAAGVACFVVASRGRREERALWTFLGLGAVAWALGDMGFTIYGLMGIDPSGRLTLADAGYLGLIPLWIAAIIYHPSRSRRSIDRFGAMISALTIVAVIATITMAYVLTPALDQAEDAAGAIVNLAYPVGDLALLAVLISMRARSWARMRLGDLLLVASFVVFAVGDIVYVRLALFDAYDVGHLVDLSWSTSFVLLAFAAGRSMSDVEGKDEQRAVIPMLALFAIVGQLAVTALAAATRFSNRALLAGAVTSGLLLVARLIVLLVDRARLLASYDAKVQQLEEANAARERFIATVSHDLRSPLASISGFAELLREPEIQRDPAQVADMTNSIERNARRLTRLAEDLLCAGQFAAGHPPPLRLKAIDLRQTAEEVLNDTGRADQIKVEGSRWVYAMADRQRVQQILMNLLDNAVKHSRSDDIKIKVRQSDKGAEMEVVDHGVGIPPERIAQIFDPFISDFSKQANAGLGLYVVANLVGAMHGRIDVTSEPNVGTTFTIVLPLAIPESSFLTSAGTPND